MKFFKYEPRGLWSSYEDSARRRRFESAPKKRRIEKECWKAVEVCRASCKSKGYQYRIYPLVPAIYVSVDVGHYLEDLLPPVWKALDVVVIE